eukprot:gene2512-12872_t
MLLVLLHLVSGLASPPTVRLANGLHMPAIHFGTPSCGSSSVCSQNGGVAVSQALPLGFTAIDTAHHYMCQTGVAAGIAKSGIARDALWITTKVEACNNTFVRLGHCADDTMARFEDDLHQLDTSYVDLMLLHAPTSTGGGSKVYPGPAFGEAPCDCNSPAACAPMQQQWAVLEEMYKANKTRAIGVSNYCKACLDCIAKTGRIVPHVNQIQLHVGMGGPNPGDLPAECSGSMAVLGNPDVVQIGKQHGVSSAQVALRWLYQHSVPMVTAASANQTEYMAEDLAIFDWTLSDAEMAQLDTIKFANESAANQSPVKAMCNV